MKSDHCFRLAARLWAALVAAIIGTSAVAVAQVKPTDPKQTTPAAAQVNQTSGSPARTADDAKPPSAATAGTQEPTGPAKPPAAGSAGQKPADPKAAQPAPPAARDLSPEAKALRDASSVTDPDKQVEALKKLIADFPKAAEARTAEDRIISTLTRRASGDIKALQEQASKYVDIAAPPNEQARRLGYAATGFVGASVLLEDAERYAKMALERFANERAWIEAERKTDAESEAERLRRDPKAKPRPAPTDAEYSNQFVSAKQAGLMTLGQIYDKRGKTADAENTYREAYTLRPRTGAAAALKLADHAKAAHHPFEQLEHLTVATLAGKVTAASRADLEAVFRQTHGGSPADLDKMLDERYEKDAPRVETKPYTASNARTDRMVVAELFTGAGCGPCVAADMAFEAALERYSAKDLAVLVYHLHIPRPDPMTNPSTQTRKDFYDVPGTPTYVIDGSTQRVGGGGAAQAEKLFKDSIESVVDKRLESKPGARIKLRADLKNGNVAVAAEVGKTAKTGKPGQKTTLHVALVEELVHYTGENGVRFHPMVVRSLASADKDTLGFAVIPGQALKVTHTFDVAKVVADAKAHLDDMEGGSSQRFGKFQFIERKNAIDMTHLRVVAFVQDEQTKEILQAAAVDLPEPPTAR